MIFEEVKEVETPNL